MYGRYQWPVIGAYLVSVALQIPFMQLSFFTGAIARILGADMAWVPGLIIPGVLYYCIERARPSLATALAVTPTLSDP
jgi:NCS1 family nucleobase:cation symporter-1